MPLQGENGGLLEPYLVLYGSAMFTFDQMGNVTQDVTRCDPHKSYQDPDLP